ncbi:MAG: lytic murein transglycosylase [Actinomycetota bacterium]|nr:lytic murein transglycosylase [Actinomycetota bacterium]
MPLPTESLTAPGTRELVRSLEDLVGRAGRVRSAIADAEAAIGRLELELGDGRRQADGAEATARRLRTELARFEAELHRLDAQRPGMARHASPPPRTVPLIESSRQLLRIKEELAGRVTAHAEQLVGAERTAEAGHRTAAAKVEELERQRHGLAALREELARVPSEMEVAAGLAAASGRNGEGPTPSTLARADIPTDYLDRYRRAALTCPGLQWSVLAAIGSVESSHGRADLPGVRSGANFAGAMGPMQFLAETWGAYGKDGDGDGTADVYDPDDAVVGAASYLCASGAGEPSRLGAAIWAYNHADWYVAAVLARAAAYGATTLETASADAEALVANPNLTVSEEAKADLLSGTVDARVVAALAAVLEEHGIVVSVIKTGHSQFVRATDRVSNHHHARAVDITSVDGTAVSASNQAALGLAVAFLTADASLRPDELGSPWPDLAQFPGAFSDADHAGHLHLGWRSNDTASSPDAEIS